MVEHICTHYKPVLANSQVGGFTIHFVDGRTFTFPVSGAMMTAVDGFENRVMMFRRASSRPTGIEVAFHPAWPLTDDLVVAVASRFLDDFYRAGGAGGA